MSIEEVNSIISILESFLKKIEVLKFREEEYRSLIWELKEYTDSLKNKILTENSGGVIYEGLNGEISINKHCYIKLMNFENSDDYLKLRDEIIPGIDKIYHAREELLEIEDNLRIFFSNRGLREFISLKLPIGPIPEFADSRFHLKYPHNNFSKYLKLLILKFGHSIRTIKSIRYNILNLKEIRDKS